jgi:hypothetical protein
MNEELAKIIVKAIPAASQNILDSTRCSCNALKARRIFELIAGLEGAHRIPLERICR